MLARDASTDLDWIRAEMRSLSSIALGRLARPFVERCIRVGELDDGVTLELRLIGEVLRERIG